MTQRTDRIAFDQLQFGGGQVELTQSTPLLVDRPTLGNRLLTGSTVHVERWPPVGDHRLLVEELRVDRVLGVLVAGERSRRSALQLQVGWLLVELLTVHLFGLGERRIDGGQILNVIASQVQVDQVRQVLGFDRVLVDGQIAERQAVSGEIQVDQTVQTGEHLTVQLSNGVLGQVETLEVLQMRERVYADLADAVTAEHQVLESVEALQGVTCEVRDLIATQIKDLRRGGGGRI